MGEVDFIEYIELMLVLCILIYVSKTKKKWCSLISLADQNNKWAKYARPGGWNGNFINLLGELSN